MIKYIISYIILSKRILSVLFEIMYRNSANLVPNRV